MYFFFLAREWIESVVVYGENWSLRSSVLGTGDTEEITANLGLIHDVPENFIEILFVKTVQYQMQGSLLTYWKWQIK